MMRTRVINSDLEDGALELVNWLLSEPSEIRFFEDDKIFVFMSHYDVEEYFKLIEKIEYEPWVDGTTDLEYNGQDYIIDVHCTLQNHDIDIEWFKKLYEEVEDE